MCRQKVALQMIKNRPDKGGLSQDAITLCEMQCEDSELMEKRMTDIEHKVDTLGHKVDSLDSKMDEIKDLITQRSTFTENLKDVFSNKVFIYLLVTIMTIMFGSAAKVGISLLQ